MKNVDLSGTTAFDANSLNALKLAASKENSPETIKEVAKQFEAVFMNMMLKSMREATPQESPFDNEQSRTFTTMLDQQLSNNLASKGLGLSDILAKQLSQGGLLGASTMEQAVSDPTTPENNSDTLENPLSGGSALHSYLLNQANGFYPSHLVGQSKRNAASAQPSNQNNTVSGEATSLTTNGVLNSNKDSAKVQEKTQEKSKEKSSTPNVTSSSDFKKRMAEHAQEASRTTGIPTQLMLGQAALESGWGKREIKGKDGTPSFNLFGIKATPGWKGKVVETTTTEYVNGVKQKHVTKFRAYDSYADSFKDFAKLMQNNPRYQNVMDNLHSADSYAQAMQKAGYATDPSYANKLASVINRVSST